MEGLMLEVPREEAGTGAAFGAGVDFFRLTVVELLPPFSS